MTFDDRHKHPCEGIIPSRSHTIAGREGKAVVRDIKQQLAVRLAQCAK